VEPHARRRAAVVAQDPHLQFIHRFSFSQSASACVGLCVEIAS
jgi:hypothetical protein